MKKTIAILLAALMLLSVSAACAKKKSKKTGSADSGANDVFGIASPTPVPDPLAELYGTWVLQTSDETDVLRFRENHTVTSRIIIPASGIDWLKDSYYTVENGQIVIDGNSAADYSIRGDKLTLVIDGVDYVLTRDDSAESMLTATPVPVSDQGPVDRLYGTWELEQDGIIMTMEFKANGTLIIEGYYDGGLMMSQEYTYTVENGLITVDGDSEPYTLSGNTLTLGEGADAMVFTRR